MQQNLFWGSAALRRKKEDKLVDLEGGDYCIDLFKIAWLGCRGFQKYSNAGFKQS